MSDSEIQSCLAYEVLSRPNDWLGTPSAGFLNSLLSGAARSCELARVGVPIWRIGGVLYTEEFVNDLKDRYGMAELNCLWASVIDSNFHSGREGLAYLHAQALNWQREHGVSDTPCDRGPNLTPAEFWPLLFKRPGLYIGGLGTTTGWDLYCALVGMTRGCDWLGIPRLPGGTRSADTDLEMVPSTLRCVPNGERRPKLAVSD